MRAAGIALPAISPRGICVALVEKMMPLPVSPSTTQLPAGPGTEAMNGAPVA